MITWLRRFGVCGIIALPLIGIVWLWRGEEDQHMILASDTVDTATIILEERGFNNRKIIVTQDDREIIISDFDLLDKQDMNLLYQQLITLLEREQNGSSH